jgi:hypothetical protein
MHHEDRAGWLAWLIVIKTLAPLTATTGGSRLHTLPLPYLHRWLIVDGRSAHPFFDLPRHSEKSLLNVSGVLCGCFEEWNPEAIGELLEQGIVISLDIIY